ncbi:MAG: hypothetical protein IT462_04590 [Planctomycetes bacterium]|nr:hypothetical protein [Planctomycetota bacterium]
MPQSRRLLAIANPISGRGLAVKVAPRLAQLAKQTGVEIDLRLTQSAGDGRNLASRAAADGFSGVIAVGGDGTINEVVNGLGANGLPLMVIAKGTGNVLAKEIGAPSDPMRYLKPLMQWKTFERDLGRLNDGRLFTCFVGAGFDGECTRLLKERRHGAINIVQYGPIILEALNNARFTTLDVEMDGRKVFDHASYALTSITPRYGGPIELASDACPDDGKLDLMATHEAISWWSVFKMMVRGLLRRVKDSRASGFFRGARVSVNAHEPGGAPVPIQVDGDFAGHLPYSAEIIPAGLTLFATR